MTSLRVGAWAGIVGPVAYVLTWAIAGAVRPGYDPTSQAISELGEVGASTRPAMTAAFVVFGVTALPFARALRALPGAGAPLVAAAVVSGVATIGAGVFPCTQGCPGFGATVTDTGHAITATVGYVALMATPALAAQALWRAGPSWRGFAWWSLACAVVGTLAMLGWALGWAGAAGGAVQRGFNTLADVWWVTAGVVLLRRTLVPARRSG